MDFERKYPIAQRPNESLLVQWTRGYKEVELHFNDKLIGSVSGASKLKKGITLSTDAGIIKLKLSDKPMTLDVIVDNYHSPINTSHPKKELKKSATFFWMIMAFAIIGGLMEGMQVGIGIVGQIVISVNVVIIAVYLTAAIGVSKGQAWAYYLGLSFYSLTTFLALFTLLTGNFILIIAFVVRGVMLYFIISNAKHAIGTIRHKQLEKNRMTESLLDQ